MLACNNVLDMECDEWQIFLMAMAVLAPILGTFAHEAAERSVDGHVDYARALAATTFRAFA